ncbi:MAG TPA: hypothetical protein VEA69_17750 [Tepidisphaeraceae bacterium]|nr:hypothetical protein [Tepidisphaeraceae bacterium]
MSTERSTTFVVKGICTAACVACEKQTQVFQVESRGQAMNLCPRDFFKQVKIATASANAGPTTD